MTVPQPKEFRGSIECSACACTWTLDDLGIENPVQDWCKEPEPWRIDGIGCACHSRYFVEGRQMGKADAAAFAKKMAQVYGEPA